MRHRPVRREPNGLIGCPLGQLPVMHSIRGTSHHPKRVRVLRLEPHRLASRFQTGLVPVEPVENVGPHGVGVRQVRNEHDRLFDLVQGPLEVTRIKARDGGQ